MIKKIDNKNSNLAEELLEIQTSSYKVEAEHIGFDNLQPLKDTVETFRSSEEIFYGYYIKEKLIMLFWISIVYSFIRLIFERALPKGY